ncbi:HAD family hydrolase [Streptococcus uberis]
MIKGILFDKDGTIIDFFKLWQPAVAPVLNRLIDDYQLYPKSLYFPKLERAIGILDGQIDPEGAIAWKPYQLIAENLGQVIQEVQVDLDYQLLTHRLQDYFAEAVAAFKGEIPTFTDMISLFSTLKEEDIAIGVVTTDTFLSTWDTMRELGLDHFISFVGTCDNSRPIKPDGELVNQAAKLWGCQADEIVVVGDTPNDMRFAKNGKAVAVGVTSGAATEESLSHYTAYIIPSVADLLPLLEKL